MSMSDPIAEMLTRIRNANTAFHNSVDIPASKIKKAIAKVLKEEGYVKHYKFIDDRKQGLIRIYLKYSPEKKRVITGLKRISKPGCRVYVKNKEVPKVLNGLGIAILSTPKGIKTDRRARKDNVGGEVLCYVW